MEQVIKCDKVNFNQMEKEILKEVIEVSKNLISTFEFKMIFGMNTKLSEINKGTLKGLKEFRKKHWDTKLKRKEAYKAYLNLY